MPECLFNTLAGLRPATLLRRDSGTGLWPYEFCEIFRNTFFTGHFRATASGVLQNSHEWTCVGVSFFFDKVDF